MASKTGAGAAPQDHLVFFLSTLLSGDHLLGILPWSSLLGLLRSCLESHTYGLMFVELFLPFKRNLCLHSSQ